MKMFKNRPSLPAEALRVAKGQRSNPASPHYHQDCHRTTCFAMTIRRMLKSEAGYALPMALILLLFGGFFVVPCLNLLHTSLKANIMVDESDLELYAADAGVDHALWRFEHDATFTPPAQGSPDQWQLAEELNDRRVDVTLTNEGEQGYKITSIATSADGDSTTIESYVDIIPAAYSVFDYAAVALGSDGTDCDIDLGGNSDIKAEVELEGNIYAVGNICLSGNAKVDGDATATGTINTSGNGGVLGEEMPYDTNPPTAPEIDTDAYKEQAQAAGCPECGSWTHSPDLSIGGLEEETLAGIVCVEQDLSVSSLAKATFEREVKVGRNATIATGYYATFEETVCVGQDLTVSGNADATFHGPVKVEGDLDLSTNGDVQFGSTIYVGGNLTTGSNTDVTLGGTVYVMGNINISANTDLYGLYDIIGEGDISIGANSSLNDVDDLAPEDIPFIISTGGDITFLGNGYAAGIVYAPEGDIYLGGNSGVYGSVVGQTVTGLGNNGIVYPVGLRDVDELHGGEDGGIVMRTYTIQ